MKPENSSISELIQQIYKTSSTSNEQIGHRDKKVQILKFTELLMQQQTPQQRLPYINKKVVS